MKAPIVAAILWLAVSAFAADINLKYTGISVDVQGTAGTDYVVERLWYDPVSDDDVVIYLKSTVPIALGHNADNLLGKGYPVNGQNPGAIWYKIDGDECAIGQKYHQNVPGATGEQGTSVMYDTLIYNKIQFKYSSSFTLAGFKGKVNMTNGQPEYNSKHFHYGLTDTCGDEWHTLTFWDDDSATALYVDNLYAGNGDIRDATASDGKIVQVVLDPRTPALQCTAAAGEEYYTTPPKTYYTPHIFNQTTYLTAGVKLRLYNLLNADIVYYRINNGTWQSYTGELTASALFSTSNTVYNFEYKNGTAGTVKLRKVHYVPAQPAQSEVHPKLRFANDAELTAMRAKVKGGDAALTSWYNSYKGEYYQVLAANYRSGMRNLNGTFGYASYYYFIKSVGNTVFANAFVGRIENNDETYLRHAKEGLLYLHTIDALGCENTDGRSGGPCQERVMYSDGKCTFGPSRAYDLLFNYTRENGFTNGMTPIEHIKIRDNLAGEAAILIKYPNSTGGGFWSTAKYGDMSTRNVQIEQTFTCIALAMPTYNTEYYGTSGADKATAATHYFAPLPEMPMAWTDVSDKEYITHPTLPQYVHNTTVHGIFTADGGYVGQPRDGYIGMMMREANDYLIARLNFDGRHYPRFENYFRMAILSRFPFNGCLAPQGLFEGGYSERWDMGYLVRPEFTDAGLYKWSQLSPDSVRWDDLLWADKSIRPAAPVLPSRVEQSWAVLASSQTDPDAVMLYMATTPEDVTHIGGTYINYRPYFTISAYGERVALEKAGYRQGVYYYMTSLKRKNTIMIDNENNYNYQQPNAEFYGALISPRMDGLRLRTTTAASQASCSFKKYTVTLERQVFFPDKKYYIFGDRLTSGSGSHTYTWLLHGATGGAGGAFVADDANNRAVWTKPSGVRLIARFAGDVALTDSVEIDYIDSTAGIPEPFIKANRTGTNVNFLTVLYPANHGQADPVITPLTVAGAQAVTVLDGGDSSLVCAAMRDSFGTSASVTIAQMVVNADLALYREDKSGRLTYYSLTGGKQFTHRGTMYLSADAALYVLVEPTDTLTTLIMDSSTGAPATAHLTAGGLRPNTQYRRIINGIGADTLTTDGAGACSWIQTLGKQTIVLSRNLGVGINDPRMVVKKHQPFIWINNPVRQNERVEIQYALTPGDGAVPVMEISTARGEVLTRYELKTAAGRIDWDRKNRNGETLADGLYYVTIINGKERMTQRIVVLR
jgi:hypothetical protein